VHIERSVMQMMGSLLALSCCLAALLGSFSVASAGDNVPAAIFQDPAIDSKYPASGAGVQFASHGVLINAQLYRPAGAGVHPTVILLHGVPGNEQNLDLARAIQRSGWTVITFHYRGSWGTPGSFRLRGGIDDAGALIGRLKDRERAKAWGVDPNRLVLAGHSYGGYVAARVAAENPRVLGVALIAPWDISYDARTWSGLSMRQRAEAGAAGFNDVDGRMAATTAASLTTDVVRNGSALNLTALSRALSTRRLLLVIATRDDPDDRAIGLRAALGQRARGAFESKEMITDHGFNDHRIALEIVVLNWLERLPGAP
jgi:pimeloyl-ACP methyl ester carboxylesterase